MYTIINIHYNILVVHTFSVGTSFATVIILSLCLCILVHLRHVRARSSPEGPRRQDFVNSIYAICAPNTAHTYVNDGKLPNLPDYSPPINPPSYDEIDQCDELGEIPPIYEEIPAKRTEPMYENIHRAHENLAFSHTDEKVLYKNIWIQFKTCV